MQERFLRPSGLLLLAVGVLLGLGTPSARASGWGAPAPAASQRPIVFVHGGAGSGAQFETQAMRFASNGYPSSRIHVFEYDSQFKVETYEQVQARLDHEIEIIRRASDADQVDLLCHSLGTRVSQTYLSETPEQARKVAHYVNIDGYPAEFPPGQVPTLAIWAGVGTQGRTIEGATNVTIPNQTHVQVATSSEAFAEIYRFFTGATPHTLRIEPAADAPIEIAGRAVVFPENVGIAVGSAVAVWEVSPQTGARTSEDPLAVVRVTASGHFGPLTVRPGAHHELVVVRADGGIHHFFYEPFPRSDHLVRLNLSRPGQGLDARIERSPQHVALTVVRFKEFWGDQGAQNDVLSVDGVNLINDKTSPRDNRTISVYAYDDGADKASDLTKPLSEIYGTPFMTGVDLFIPAAQTQPPDQTFTLRVVPRGDEGRARTFTVPAIQSSTARVTVQLHDWE
jgi:pimeloyl-ACP methyl ester carboxylesterase